MFISLIFRLDLYLNGILLFSDQYIDTNESSITITTTVEEDDDVIILVPRNVISNDVLETENSTLQSRKYTISTPDQESTLFLFSGVHFRSGKVLLQIEQDTNFYFSEINILQTGENAIISTEYGVLTNNSDMINTLSCSINNNDVNLNISLETSVSPANVTLHQTLIKKD
jgi:hypothetical protein